LSSVDITVVEDAEEAARLVAERLAEQARAGGSIVLTGGSTPRRAYELSAELEPDWSRVELWWGDERCVPPDDERSNYGMAKAALLDRLAGQPNEIHRIRGELGREEGAEVYDKEIDGHGAWSLLLLGLGPDGHVASLFPGLSESEAFDHGNAVGTQAGLEPFVDRITLTWPRIRGADELLFLVAGADKAAAVEQAFAGDSFAIPARRARAWSGGRTRAILDRAAAARL
jgi:6-phosphogluconolactonase